jgi:hypothetical protein
MKYENSGKPAMKNGYNDPNGINGGSKKPDSFKAKSDSPTWHQSKGSQKK